MKETWNYNLIDLLQQAKSSKLLIILFLSFGITSCQIKKEAIKSNQ